MRGAAALAAFAALRRRVRRTRKRAAVTGPPRDAGAPRHPALWHIDFQFCQRIYISWSQRLRPLGQRVWTRTGRRIGRGCAACGAMQLSFRSAPGRAVARPRQAGTPALAGRSARPRPNYRARAAAEVTEAPPDEEPQASEESDGEGGVSAKVRWTARRRTTPFAAAHSARRPPPRARRRASHRCSGSYTCVLCCTREERAVSPLAAAACCKTPSTRNLANAFTGGACAADARANRAGGQDPAQLCDHCAPRRETMPCLQQYSQHLAMPSSSGACGEACFVAKVFDCRWQMFDRCCSLPSHSCRRRQNDAH